MLDARLIAPSFRAMPAFSRIATSVSTSATCTASAPATPVLPSLKPDLACVMALLPLLMPFMEMPAPVVTFAPSMVYFCFFLLLSSYSIVRSPLISTLLSATVTPTATAMPMLMFTSLPSEPSSNSPFSSTTVFLSMPDGISK